MQEPGGWREPKSLALFLKGPENFDNNKYLFQILIVKIIKKESTDPFIF